MVSILYSHSSIETMEEFIKRWGWSSASIFRIFCVIKFSLFHCRLYGIYSPQVDISPGLYWKTDCVRVMSREDVYVSVQWTKSEIFYTVIGSSKRDKKTEVRRNSGKRINQVDSWWNNGHGGLDKMVTVVLLVFPEFLSTWDSKIFSSSRPRIN